MMPTQLAALLGKEAKEIRKANERPPRASIIDVAGPAQGTMQITQPKRSAMYVISKRKSVKNHGPQIQRANPATYAHDRCQGHYLDHNIIAK